MIVALVAALALAQAAEPAAATEVEPPFLKALEAAGVDPKTKLNGADLQVMFGQRAVLRLDAKKKPILEGVEVGRIDRATTASDPQILKGVGANHLGFALDASSAKRQSMMKVWNGLTYPVAFETEIVALRGGQLMKKKIPLCVVAAGGAAYETWSDPIIAVTVSSLGEPPANAPACNNEND